MRSVMCAVLALALLGCSDEPSTSPPPERAQAAPDVAPDERAIRAVKSYVDAQVATLSEACAAICAAAPEPDADGWSMTSDRVAIEQMRASWRRARVSYERVEGAIAILFPETDADVDGRYERVAELARDPAPFDGNGFVGMHALERILWSEGVPDATLVFERALPGYDVPRTPRDETEARAFRDGLCARLVRDVRAMEHELGPIALDPATAWRGIQGSIEEQAEKVLLGTTGEDESRYASHTLADMRANLEGGRAVLAAFAPQIEGLPSGDTRLAAIRDRLDVLERAYREAGADALPPAPTGFDLDAPSANDLATPYGRLFALLREAGDPRATGTLASMLRETGDAMGIPAIGR